MRQSIYLGVLYVSMAHFYTKKPKSVTSRVYIGEVFDWKIKYIIGDWSGASGVLIKM